VKYLKAFSHLFLTVLVMLVSCSIYTWDVSLWDAFSCTVEMDVYFCGGNWCTSMVFLVYFCA